MGHRDVTKASSEGRALSRKVPLGVLLAIASLGIALGVVEGVVRATGRDRFWIRRALEYQVVDLGNVRVALDPFLHYELAPGTHAILPRSPGSDCGDPVGGTYEVTIGPLGEREPSHPERKEPGVFRIVVVGASSTYGSCVSDRETLPAALERVLNRETREPSSPRFEVLNFAVGDWQISQMARKARQVLAARQADLVLVQDRVHRRRAFLGTPESVASIGPDLFLEDAEAFRENFPPVLLPETLHRAAFRYSALYRAIVGLVRSRWPDWAGQEQQGAEASRETNRRELQRLAEEARAAGVPVHVFEPPTPTPDGRGGSGRVIPPRNPDLEGIPGVTASRLVVEGLDPVLFRAHPPPWVLERWAEDLADDLRMLGLVPVADPGLGAAVSGDPGGDLPGVREMPIVGVVDRRGRRCWTHSSSRRSGKRRSGVGNEASTVPRWKRPCTGRSGPRTPRVRTIGPPERGVS
ncbi:MAG TPA: hypothetical protein PLQ97_05580 [Myxococcota bacterium]|nr:hypothetical protein [Myxococcota bacterium]HQK50133.1 hypothetical protein [Myxococcota bacterium]